MHLSPTSKLGYLSFNRVHHVYVYCSVIVRFHPPNIWIKIKQIAFQIDCLHGTKFTDPDCNLERDNFAPC